MKLTITVLKTSLLLGFGAMVLLTIAAYLNLPTPIKPLVVKTGSMEPSIPAGSLVLVTKKTEVGNHSYLDGDIITFRVKNDLVSHRVTRVIQNGSEKLFATKGDANKTEDTQFVSEKDVVGKVGLTVPYVGRIVDFVKTPLGFVLLIVIPTLALIFSELLVIYEELFRKKSSADVNFTKPLAMFFVAAIFLGSSNAFFSDVGTSINNTFTTAQVFTDHLVINEVMFNPPNTNACGNEGDAEWVEIYNPTNNSINLDTWSVGDSNSTDDLPNILLPGGGYAVVSDCPQASFTTIWSLPAGTTYIDLSSNIGNGLNNGGEQMRLFNGSTLIDSMSYGSNTDAFLPSVVAPVANHSLERSPDGVDSDSAADFVDRTTPTPGI